MGEFCLYEINANTQEVYALRMPQYLKIKHAILNEIQKKPVNTPIDSERDLSTKFQVSRMTVRKAINELVESGILYRDKNKGTFIADQTLLKKNTAKDVLKQSGQQTYKIIYFNIKKAEENAHYLDIGRDELLLRIVKVNQINNVPFSIEEVYFIRNKILDKDMQDLHRLLNMQVLMDEGSVSQNFTATKVPIQYANLLQISLNVPILKVESTIRNKMGSPIVFICTYHNAEKQPVEITT